MTSVPRADWRNPRSAKTDDGSDVRTVASSLMCLAYQMKLALHILADLPLNDDIGENSLGKGPGDPDFFSEALQNMCSN